MSETPEGTGEVPSGHAAPGERVAPGGTTPARRERKSVLLRLDPAVHDALARWAADDLRSVNAQIELLLRRALTDAHRMPSGTPPPRGRGRPRGT